MEVGEGGEGDGAGGLAVVEDEAELAGLAEGKGAAGGLPAHALGEGGGADGDEEKEKDKENEERRPRRGARNDE